MKLPSFFNPLSANPTTWPNTLNPFVGSLPTNCLSVFDHFVGLALKDLSVYKLIIDSFIKYSQRESFRNFILLLG